MTPNTTSQFEALTEHPHAFQLDTLKPKPYSPSINHAFRTSALRHTTFVRRKTTDDKRMTSVLCAESWTPPGHSRDLAVRRTAHNSLPPIFSAQSWSSKTMSSSPCIPWSTEPPPTAKAASTQIYRCGKNGTGRFAILCEQITGCEVHFYRGRTIPCLMKSEGWCLPCEDPKGNASRWRGYLSVIQTHTHQTFLLELTPPCCGPLQDYLRDYRTLRGAVIELHRQSGKPNGRITASINRLKIDIADLPEPLDVKSQLATIWEIHKLERGLGHPPINDSPAVNRIARKNGENLLDIFQEVDQ